MACEPRSDSEVLERAKPPRRFSAEDKARILAEYEHLSKAEKGALLRSEGRYSSLVTEWRRQADAGAHEALGRLAGHQQADPRDRQIATLKKEDEKLSSHRRGDRTEPGDRRRVHQRGVVQADVCADQYQWATKEEPTRPGQ